MTLPGCAYCLIYMGRHSTRNSAYQHTVGWVFYLYTLIAIYPFAINKIGTMGNALLTLIHGFKLRLFVCFQLSVSLPICESSG